MKGRCQRRDKRVMARLLHKREHKRCSLKSSGRQKNCLFWIENLVISLVETCAWIRMSSYYCIAPAIGWVIYLVDVGIESVSTWQLESLILLKTV